MLRKALIPLLFLALMLALSPLFFSQLQKRVQSGAFFIYFMDEQVGYEEYTWEEDERGYLLSVKGRMTKPASLEIERLNIRLDKSFVPSFFYFKGAVNDMAQEVSSSITEGEVENKISVAGQESISTVKIRRDAFLLPNPVFSPYLILTKKFRCTLEEKVDLSAYIIPQFEVPITLEPMEEDPCSLIMELSGIQIHLNTDEEGELLSISVPSQKLEVIRKED